MEEVLDAILHNAVSVIVAAALGAVWVALRHIWKQMRATQGGLQCVLRTTIIDIHKRALDKGYCRIYEKENLTHAYEAYKALGGNGVVKSLYNETMEFPTEPEEEENEN